jgi:hypothetical protein
MMPNGELDSPAGTAEQASSPIVGLAPGGALNAREQQIDRDYEWCLHDAEVRRRFGGQVVAAHKGRVWGAGPTHRAALQAALREPGCPEHQAMAFVVVPEAPSEGGPISPGE